MSVDVLRIFNLFYNIRDVEGVLAHQPACPFPSYTTENFDGGAGFQGIATRA